MSLAFVAALFLLAGCSTSPNGRLQMTAPAPVSQIYSEVDLQLSLATAASVLRDCNSNDCSVDQQFDQHVQQTGEKLSQAAAALFPDSFAASGQFSFEVAEKSRPGTSSNAAGKIVLTRGIQEMQLDDPALAFLMAREMGRVIGNHHDENAGTRILISVLAGVLFPASGLFSAGSAATQATATSSVISSAGMAAAAASSVTSYIGSKIALESIRPKQMSEADFIAVALLREAGWNLRDIRDAFAASPSPEAEDAWCRDFRNSLARLDDWGRQAAAAEVIAKAEAESAERAELTRLAALEQLAAVAPEGAPEQSSGSANTATPAAELEDSIVTAEPVLVASLDNPITPDDATPAAQDNADDDIASGQAFAEESSVETPEAVAEQRISLIPAVAMTSPAAAKLIRSKPGAIKTRPLAKNKLARGKQPDKTRMASARGGSKLAAAKKNSLKVASAKPEKLRVAANTRFVSKVTAKHHNPAHAHVSINKTIRAAGKHPVPKL